MPANPSIDAGVMVTLPTPSPYEVEAQVEALKGAADALIELAAKPSPGDSELAGDKAKLHSMAEDLKARAAEMKKLLARKSDWEAVSEEVISVLHGMDDALGEISTGLETAKDEAPSEAQREFAAEAYTILEHL